jgi:hypothetical protein
MTKYSLTIPISNLGEFLVFVVYILYHRRKDFVWTMNSVICSWHFPHGKEDGPSRFHWNERKDFKLNGLANDTGNFRLSMSNSHITY